MYHYHQLNKMANFFWPGTAVQRYRANFILEEAILFPQYRGTGVQATNIQNVAINTTSEKYRGTQVQRKIPKSAKVNFIYRVQRYIGTKTNTKTPEMTTILTKYISTEVQSQRGTKLNFSVKQLNIDQIHRYRGTQLKFSAVYPLIQQNFIDSSPRYRGTKLVN